MRAARGSFVCVALVALVVAEGCFATKDSKARAGREQSSASRGRLPIASGLDPVLVAIRSASSYVYNTIVSTPLRLALARTPECSHGTR